MGSLIIDTDPQATASQCADWRRNASSRSERQPSAVSRHQSGAGEGQGAQLIVIDPARRQHPPCRSLMLIPCRQAPSTSRRFKPPLSWRTCLKRPMLCSPPRLTHRVYGTGQLVNGFGTPACPLQIPDLAAYRHASDEGRTVVEIDPGGKAADKIRQLYYWMCRQVDKPPQKAAA